MVTEVCGDGDAVLGADHPLQGQDLTDGGGVVHVGASQVVAIKEEQRSIVGSASLRLSL